MARSNQLADVEGASSYLREIVFPAVAELEANPTSRRHAFMACVVVFHTVDHMFPHRSAAKRGQYRDQSADFALVDRVAHAFKHVRSDGRAPLSHGQVVARPPALPGEMVLGRSVLGDAVGSVIVEATTPGDLMPAVKRAVQFLRDEIERAAGD